MTAPGTRSGYNEQHNSRYEETPDGLSGMPLTANDCLIERPTAAELLS